MEEFTDKYYFHDILSAKIKNTAIKENYHATLSILTVSSYPSLRCSLSPAEGNDSFWTLASSDQLLNPSF